MLDDEGEQQEEDCYHIDMRMLRGIIGVSRRDHVRNEEIRRTLGVQLAPRLCAVAVFVGLKMSKKRCERRHPQSDGAGNTGYQTTRTAQEDIAPTDQGRHDGRGCYPGRGPRPEGVEKKDTAEP